MKKNVNSCDILVVGAGAAGCAAAVTAAEAGAQVVLLERCHVPGGAYCQAHLETVCGLYRENKGSNSIQPLQSNFITEWLNLLKKHRPHCRPRREGMLYTQPCDSRLMQQILQEMIKNCTPQLCWRSRSELIAVKMQENRIVQVEVEHDGHREWLTVGAVIDCSGNGSVISRLPYSHPHTTAAITPLAALPFHLPACPYDELISLRIAYRLTKQFQSGELPSYWRFLTLRDDNNGGINGWFNFPPTNFNNPAAAIEELQLLLNTLSKSKLLPQQTRPDRVGDTICRRDAPVIDGRYCLTETDIIKAAAHADGRISANWPIELWHPEQGQQLYYPEAMACYQIPDNCLRSATTVNLFAGGKTISATVMAQAAVRVTAIAFATGERAAILALRATQTTPFIHGGD